MIEHRKIMELIRKNSTDCTFTVPELGKWILQEYKHLNKASSYMKAYRVIKWLPVESLSKSYYRLLIIPELPQDKKKPVNKELNDSIREIIAYFNEKTGKNYKGQAPDLVRIKARMSPPENFTVSDFKKVIDKKCLEWRHTDMEAYLRPETLFGTKFESYLNQAEQAPKVSVSNMSRYDFSKYIQE